jgi:D-alanine-D-alanine ligase
MSADLARYRIAVVAGGVSSEREVSLRSGAAVHAALRSKGLAAQLLDVDTNAVSQIQAVGADLVFIALHGAFGEDGQIQSALEKAGIAYTGSGPEACRRAMDKEVSRQAFRKAGLSEPRWKVLRTGETLGPNEFNYPIFVKPCCGGSSIGVSQVRASDDLPSALAAAFAEDDKIIVESKISGREMAVGILGDRALPAIEIRPARDFYDYAAKYTNAGTLYVFPDDISEERQQRIRASALRAHRALGCGGYSRVDLIVTAEDDFPLEVNASPGMTATSLLPKEAARDGIPFADLCVMMMEESLKQVKFHG